MDRKVIGSGRLNSRKNYLQIALNSTLEEARLIISQLPIDERIILEAGTPFIKRYGISGIERIREWYRLHLMGLKLSQNKPERENFPIDKLSPLIISLIKNRGQEPIKPQKRTPLKTDQIDNPYIVADLKMMDRGMTEVEIAAHAGANAAVALGSAPVESLNTFIDTCEELELDSMIDMMNVEYPLSVLKALKRVPVVVILHRGVDEERFNKEKKLPLHEIRRIKGNYDILISVAGGDSIREVQRAIFNDADIVVVWKSFYQSSIDTANLAQQFLKEIK